MSKKALITGITGQDGSYLAELLLEKGYEVHGIIRRSSSFNTGRIDHIFPQLNLHFGDLADSSSLRKLMEFVHPDEVYHLGAQSHVRVSFDIPEYTCDIDALGTLRLLESIRDVDTNIKFYNAGSSEMFGKAKPPQNEDTPFEPRSPYACAKVFSYYTTINYREAYGIHASNGILFNHECLVGNMPVIVKTDNLIDIKPISELIAYKPKGPNNQSQFVYNTQIWDKDGWVDIKYITAKKYNGKIRRIVSRMGTIDVTPEHIMLDADGGDIQAEALDAGIRLEDSALPKSINSTTCCLEKAWFLGAMCADGSVSNGNIRFVNKNKSLLEKMAALWVKITGESYNIKTQTSGFTGKKDIFQLNMVGDSSFSKWLLENIYVKTSNSRKKEKRIPKIILNSSKDIISAFLDGYCEGDGTKSLPKAAYRFQYFTTISPSLALGLRYCIDQVYGSDVTYNVYGKDKHVYKGFIRSTRDRGLNGQKGNSGRNLIKDQNEITKIIDYDLDDWVFDIETSSGKFTAGTGRLRVHNSPRRGETFVTRKITKAAGRIVHGLQDELRLGNLAAKRDWGYSKDYMEAIYLMLQQDQPDDYVVATGTSYSVEDFLKLVFKKAGLNWKDYVVIDPHYFRPTEVDHLEGNPSKIKAALGWEPKVDLEKMADLMLAHDLEEAAKEKVLRDAFE